MEKTIPCEVKLGRDGRLWAVFKNNLIAEDYATLFSGCCVGCFGEYENAYLLPCTK